MDILSSSVSKHKISQTEFNELYLASLDDINYRYINNEKPIFDLPKLLDDHGFLLDLSGLNLRHLNFRHAIFSNICLDYSDLRGAICHHADFSKVNCEKIIIDIHSQFHGAKLSKEQLLSLQAHTQEKTTYIGSYHITNSIPSISDEAGEWGFA